MVESGDFEESVEQYIHTIGMVQPSQIIQVVSVYVYIYVGPLTLTIFHCRRAQKFLDPQRLLNLICYLEALAAKGQGTKDTMVLLLSSLTKLNDIG